MNQDDNGITKLGCVNHDCDQCKAQQQMPDDWFKGMPEEYRRAAWRIKDQPAQGCDYCNHPLYAGTKCKNCGRERPAQQQEPVAGWDSIEAMAAERYKVVPSHDSMFYRHAVVAGNGTQQLYVGRELECENMARKFAGAFLDGAFVMQSLISPPAQRKPLTRKEIADFYGGESPLVFDIIRAVEAAHGIKGDA